MSKTFSIFLLQREVDLYVTFSDAYEVIFVKCMRIFENSAKSFSGSS